VKKVYSLLSVFMIVSLLTRAQEWTLKISSNVELRTWKLTTKADKEEKPLLGAAITLYKAGKIISQSTSDGNGDFTVFVPGNGDFVLSVSYPGCNAKKFSINTTGVPPEVQKDNFKPSFSIGGFVMAKPFPGIDYSGLQQTLVKVIYEPKIKNFDDDEPYTDAGLGIVMKIADAENILINNFCNTNKAGDAALIKPDCPLAKMLYEKAIAMIPGEQYPVVQLAKVGDCLKAKEEAAKKAAEAAANKAEADKLAKEKAAAEKANKDQAAKNKAEADKLAKEKATADKAEKDKLAKENAAAKTKTANDKVAADKAAAAKKAQQKAQADKIAKQKADADKIAKQKEDANKKATGTTAEPKTAKMENTNNENAGTVDKSDSKYKVPQVLGANKYKEALTKAEGFFKMKRYAEAKTAYEDVLKIKPGDVYATNKLAEVNKFLAK